MPDRNSCTCRPPLPRIRGTASHTPEKPKSECRNPKQIRNPNKKKGPERGRLARCQAIRMRAGRPRSEGFLLWYSDLFRISSFDIRISIVHAAPADVDHRMPLTQEPAAQHLPDDQFMIACGVPGDHAAFQIGR